MKRDQSLIFTTVPEEDLEHSPINIETPLVSTKSKIRPKFLNLRSKTTDETLHSRMESSPILGPTCVSSTPLTDIKKVILPGITSICTNPNKEESNKDNSCGEIYESFKTESVNSILSAAEKKSYTSLHSIPYSEKLTTIPYLSIGASLHDKKKFPSMFELREKFKSLTKRITMKYYNRGPRNLNNGFIVDFEESPKKVSKKSFQTITDPTFPVFGNDGKVISKSLYDDYIKTHLSLVNLELSKPKDEITENTTDKLNDFDMCFREFSKKQPVIAEFEMQPLRKQQQNGTNNTKPRKSLSLPLKSLTTDLSESTAIPTNRKERFSGGVLLTPLMSKLSMLPSEEWSSGFGSRDTTPSECKDLFTPSQPNFTFLRKNSANATQEEKLLENKVNLQKCILFVCGQQDMVVNVLLEETASSCPKIINKLVKTSFICFYRVNE